MLRGKFEVNWLELVWLDKTEKHRRAHLRRGRKLRTIGRKPEPARWRREYADKLTGDLFNNKPKSGTAMGSGNLPVDLQWSTRARPNVNIDEAPGTSGRTKALVRDAKALVREHGRTRDCPRCSSGIGTHNAECRGRSEGILLQQSRMKPKQEEELLGGRTVLMESEKPTGATAHQVSSETMYVTSAGATRFADEKPLGAPVVEMGAEDSCAAQVKRAKTIMGLEICVLEAQDDVYHETPGTPTIAAENSGENATNEVVVATEVTEELNRLKTLGRAYKAPECRSADACEVRVQPEDERTAG